MDGAPPEWDQAVALEPDGDGFVGEVPSSWDVFGVAHGGVVLAMAANAALLAEGEPDLFTISGHFTAKAAFAPIRFDVEEVARSRRFTSLLVRGTQDGRPVVTALASVGDRGAFDGPTVHHREPPPVADDSWGAHAGDSDEPFLTPDVAHRMRMRLAPGSARFAVREQDVDTPATILAQVEPPPGRVADQLFAIIACDSTPPAVWNNLGMTGWVPTVELTVHVRARPAPGPLQLRVTTSTVDGGFLEEDAEVWDTSGRPVALSRQLATIRMPG